MATFHISIMRAIFNIVVVLLTFASFGWCYTLSRQYKGQDFINQFNFWDDSVQNDPTGTARAPSAAFYTAKAAAISQGLVLVNSQGNFVLAADSTNVYSGNQKRPSVRITSQQSIYHGLLILDAAHVPFGMGTWPAFWLSGADGNWPYSGEVDIIEGVGDNTQNTVSYHTGPNICSYNTSVVQTAQLNTAVGLDCNALQHNDEACGNVDPDTTSYGSGADNAGGGVWSMEWTSDHIKMWHWARNNIPTDIQSGSPNPTGWGTPVTYLSSSNCSIDGAFAAQSIVMNIELCGTWEGNVFPGGPRACLSFVQQNPQEMKTAYFEINYLSYYQ